MIISGALQGELKAPEPPNIPPDSMQKLQKLSPPIASAEKLKVKSVNIRGSICHHRDKQKPIIEFQEQDPGNDIYQLASIIVSHANRHQRELNATAG